MPADLATLSALKARVEAATGPDREIDGALMAALNPPYGRGWEEPFSYFCRYDSDGQGLFKPHAATPASIGLQVPAYTESHDAALSLLDGELGHWSREIGRSGFGNPAWCRAWNPMLSPGEGNTIRAEHNGGSEPLAILSALLTAKIAQLETSHAR